MKKIILLVVSLVFVASLFAGASGEAYMDYPLIGFDGSIDDDGGLVSGYVGIGYWGADYGFHFNYDATGGDPWTVNHMFKKFTLHPMVNLLVGKTAVPFVKENNPSGFANINIVEATNAYWTDDGIWNFVNPSNAFMLKLDGNVKGLGWQIYTANTNTGTDVDIDYADFGARLDYNVAGVEIGAGLQMETFGVTAIDSLDIEYFTGDTDSKMHWAFDLGYTAAEMVNLKLQLTNYDDGNDDTSDMNYYLVVNYVPGFKGITPYLGYYTYAEMEENVMFFGLNMNPTKDSILKLEYKMISEELIVDAEGNDLNTDRLTLQLGFSF